MKTILKKDIINEDLTGVVLFEESDSTVTLYTLNDKRGYDSVLECEKRNAIQKIDVDFLRRIKNSESPEDKDIESAVIAGVGHRGKSIADTKKTNKDRINKKMGLQDLCESKKIEVSNSKTINEVNLIIW